MEFEENASSEEKKKEQKRVRKKQLLKQLREQMEFYFSSANLSKDKFMADLIANDPFIDVEIFFKFNKIRTLTEDIVLLRKAIKKSSIIQLSEDELKVSLKVPIQEKNNEDECTIYIEKLPLHVTHEWVRKLFTQYGTIDYVSIPRYKHSGRPKGFAFLEFQIPEMAKVALEAFGIKDDVVVENIDPAELQSIKTYEGCGEKDGMSKGSEISNNSMREDNLEKKLKVDVNEEISSKEKDQNKRKLSEDENNSVQISEENELESSEPSIKKMKNLEQTASDNNELTVDESEVPKKKKKKRKKTKVKEQESESICLRVMSKKQWKVLRNRYLNLQRKNMQILKKNIMEYKYYHDNSDWNSHDLKKTSDNYEKSQMENLVMDCPTKNISSLCTKPKFIPDVVLKISFEEPPPDPRKLRETIREGGGEDVAYVDVSSRESDIYVRFKSQKSASSYLSGGCWSRMEILKGEEEKKYWDHIIQNWEERRAKRNKKDGCGGHGAMSKNIRGKDKIIQKAFQVTQKSKPNSHVIFKD